MAIKQQQINKIMKKYKDVFEALENYDKTHELKKVDNRKIVNYLGAKGLNEFKDILRCEKRYGKLKDLRNDFKIKSEKYENPLLLDLFNSKEHVNYNSFKHCKLKTLDFLPDPDEMSFISYEKYLGARSLIEKCNLDLNLIENALRTNGGSNWRNKLLPRYKSVLNDMLSNKDTHSKDLEVIDFIESELKQFTFQTLDSVKIKLKNPLRGFRMKKNRCKENLSKDCSDNQMIFATFKLLQPYLPYGVSEVALSKANEPADDVLIISFSAKVLREKYFQGININTIEYAIANINDNNHSFVLKPDLIINEGSVCYVDVTNNIKMRA